MCGNANGLGALIEKLEPVMGFEPATACLQNRCSTIELHRRRRSALATEELINNTKLVAPPGLEPGTN